MASGMSSTSITQQSKRACSVKKYAYFTLVKENEGSFVYENYREAFSEYGKFNGSASLYGTDSNGSESVIFSK